MATTTSRHHSSYARPAKTLPIAPAPKAAATYTMPMSKVGLPPPEIYSESGSTTSRGSRRSGGTFSASGSSYAPSHVSGDDYRADQRVYHADVNIYDELSDRMNNAFDTMNADKLIAKQAQTSGAMNAKQKELEEARAELLRRTARFNVKFNDAMDAGKTAKADISDMNKKMSSLKTKAARDHPEAYEKAKSSRHRK